MNNKKKRFRQAAACFLAAALTISSGPGVFSPAAEESETVQELSETDTELTAGAAEESLTETSTEPETEEQTREEAPQEKINESIGNRRERLYRLPYGGRIN